MLQRTFFENFDNFSHIFGSFDLVTWAKDEQTSGNFHQECTLMLSMTYFRKRIHLRKLVCNPNLPPPVEVRVRLYRRTLKLEFHKHKYQICFLEKTKSDPTKMTVRKLMFKIFKNIKTT